MPTNDEILTVRDRHFISPAIVHYYSTPLQLVRAQGEHVYDEKGNRYLDAFGGIICVSAGHNHPRIKARLMQMLQDDEIQHTTVLYLNHHATDLAEALIEEAPDGIDRVFFTNSGSEANELAFLAARQATGETMVINLRHSYHGGTSGALASCGHHNWRFRSQPTTATTSAMEPYCYRCPFGKKPDSCALECAQNVETTIQTTTNGKIAALIAEPIMGVGGFITPPVEYFQKVQKIVHNYGGKYISDEVQTGVGRCGENFLFTKTLGIQADMVTLAKGFGNGAAIGATLMTSELSDSLEGKFFFNTFGSDPYPTAQAKVTLEIIREEKLVDNARAMGARMKEGLMTLMQTRRLIGDVRGRGLLLGIELVKDRATKEYATAETTRLMEICRDKGLLVGKGGLYGNVIRIAPSLAIRPEQVDEILRILDEGLRDLEASPL
jgi:alanine-glyoxylate transaminase / (R)-3-amino-2-methylpropionate-pyruvate transaminase